MVLSYGPAGQGHQQARSSQRSLPGGFGAGTFLGGPMFKIKFNGACLRPPITRPISRNKAIQLKYIDDSIQATSINLQKSLIRDPQSQPKPLKYHERHETILKPEEDILQQELDVFYLWTIQNKLPMNRKKCLTMQFSRSRYYDFPMDFTIGSSTILEERATLQILGIQIQSNLRWNEQVNQMICRASKTSWVLRMMRALGVDKFTLLIRKPMLSRTKNLCIVVSLLKTSTCLITHCITVTKLIIRRTKQFLIICILVNIQHVPP